MAFSRLHNHLARPSHLRRAPATLSTVRPLSTKPQVRPASDRVQQIELDYERHVAGNYTPLKELAIARAENVFMWDVSGRRYYDFLTAFSVVNQGHGHPKILAALKEQADILTITGRNFYNNKLGEYAKYATELFGYDKLLPMNSGVEAADTSVKLARRWGYEVKGIPTNQAKVVFCSRNFWGRSIAAASASTDPLCYSGYGPFTPGFLSVPFNNIPALEHALKDNHVAAFHVEPIQGEAGIIVPDHGYLTKARELCTKYNVLLIADEIQCGLGRSGKLLTCHYESVRPDVLVLGKALSGGMMPISAVLADDHLMSMMKSGTHGSTFGGNPLASAVAIASLKAIVEEEMPENAYKMGEIFRREICKMRPDVVQGVRGKGLMNAVLLKPNGGVKAGRVIEKLRDNGVMCKNSEDYWFRMTPPLIITEDQMLDALKLISRSIEEA